MKEVISVKENEEICIACCVILSLTLPSFRGEDEQEKLIDVSRYIFHKDWKRLFGSETWIKRINLMIKTMSVHGTDPARNAFHLLLDYFNDEIDPLLIEHQKLNAFKKKYKHQDSVLFGELPIGKKFYLPSDHSRATEEGMYDLYYAKDGSTTGHVCFTITAKKAKGLGEKITVEPETTVVYLAIEAL